MVEETNFLLDLWQEGMETPELRQAALSSGHFPTMTARRLRNIIVEGFSPRYLRPDGPPALLLKELRERLTSREWLQLLFLFTARAHPILADFVREVYWPAYGAGRSVLTNKDAAAFVARANQEGRTSSPWSDGIVRRVAGYLTGTCADFGLLAPVARGECRILPFTIEPQVAAILAYELHWQGLGDNQVVEHPDWALFGLAPAEVVEVLRRLALRGFVIVQVAGGVTRLSWQYRTREALIDALGQ